LNAIFKKELRSYFSSPIGYVFVAIFFCVAGLLFTVYNIFYRMGDISYVFSNMTMIFLFLTPVLTMRLLSEDKKAKTDQLLLTAPVKVVSVVLGKFLSAVAVLAIALATTLIFPIILKVYTDPAWGEIWSNYIGFCLLGASFISIGLYISSLTENQIIAAIATFGVLFVLYLTNNFSVSFGDGFINTVIQWFSPANKFTDFSKGIISIESVIYYLSIMAAFVILTTAHIEKRRWIK